MLDITVIILTKNEEKNINASIESAKQIAERIIVVDCGSEDRTVEIAKELGADVYFHEWQGHAKQFNWALDNCEIKTEWVFRLDADERISEELANEVSSVVSKYDNYSAFELRWDMYFMGKHLKHGGNGKSYVVRLFRFGKAYVEEVLMDERFVVSGEVGRLKSRFVHYDYKTLDSFINKHVLYSNSEIESYFTGNHNESTVETSQKKRRGFYYKLPLFIRAKLYYWFRYYLQLGFLDGKEGKIFCFLQAYWYRFLVDAKIYEMEKTVKHNA